MKRPLVDRLMDSPFIGIPALWFACVLVLATAGAIVAMLILYPWIAAVMLAVVLGLGVILVMGQPDERDWPNTPK